MTETVYDRVAYPSAIVRVAHPDRLALIARLHGLSPPPPHRARVLEIGGGDGANALALAAALPDAQFLSFDLAPSAVARGAAMADRAGLTNVAVETLDILDAADRIAPGSYDYIIAHGVYAWVPEPVRAATMALIGHALSPDGVAFVSYNALPGGHIRMVMREMLIHALRRVEGEQARIEAARAFLACRPMSCLNARPKCSSMTNSVAFSRRNRSNPWQTPQPPSGCVSSTMPV
jgi:predicted O-methyltransferase YrrM